jgi:hypothetical protein
MTKFPLDLSRIGQAFTVTPCPQQTIKFVQTSRPATKTLNSICNKENAVHISFCRIMHTLETVLLDCGSLIGIYVAIISNTDNA